MTAFTRCGNISIRIHVVMHFVVLLLVITSRCNLISTHSNDTFEYQLLDKLNYPLHECLDLNPVNEYYFTKLFTFDTPLENFCSESFSSLLECEILCESNFYWDFTNKTKLMELSRIVNHCLYCNSTNTIEFLESSYGTCSIFNIFNQSIVLYQQVIQSHCNGNSNNLVNVPLFDHTFLISDYFKNTYYNYLNNLDSTISRALYLKNVSLPTLFEFYFTPIIDRYQLKSDDFNQSNSLNLQIGLNIPYLCWCDYQSDHSSFGFVCNDFYHRYQTPMAYFYAAIFFALLYIGLFFFLIFFVLIPRIAERIVSFKKKMMTNIQETNRFKTVLWFCRHLFDIVSHPIIWFCVSAFAGFLENFFRFLFNFSGVHDFFLAYFGGVFRAISAICVLCGYSSMVILWSHIIDLSQRKDSTNRKLSRINKIILAVFYVALIIALIIALIVFVSVSYYGYAWVVLAIFALIYLFTFEIGFSFYGVKIFLTLRRNNGGVLEYRFTKFILIVSVLFLANWLVVFLCVLTYAFGYDIISVFYGVTRNIFLDSCIFAVLSFSTYMTFKEETFKIVYGDKLTTAVHKVFNSSSKGESSTAEMNKQPAL